MSRIGDRQLKVLAKCDAAIAKRDKVKTILLNESDRNLAAQALQLAASKYTEIANIFSDVPSLKSQFERQAADASRIGQLIWDTNVIGLTVENDEITCDDCDCAYRSWYGDGHDSACPLMTGVL